MRCGLGVCGQCHCGDRLVCTDGPVFSGEVFLAAGE
jgi:NAD(P)H-flavin reductase